MVTKPEVKHEAKEVKNPTTPGAKDPSVLLSTEVIQGCVQQGRQAATPGEAASRTAGCLIEHLRIAKAQQTPPPKEAEAPQT